MILSWMLHHTLVGMYCAAFDHVTQISDEVAGQQTQPGVRPPLNLRAGGGVTAGEGGSTGGEGRAGLRKEED